MCKFNTDMADERVDEYKVINNMSEIDGIEVKQQEYEEFKVTEVNVLNENGEKAIDKLKGKYVTIDIDGIKYLEDETLLVEKIKEELEKVIPKEKSILVVGLGNMYVTPDALGSKVVKGVEVTRHILKLSEHFKDFGTRQISAICPGVMGNTGIETTEIVTAITSNVKPEVVIVIDSLMSKSFSRIGSSIQISNTGITPGSGITGINSKIDRESTGAEVISIGVPMVVDIATIANEIMDKLEYEEESNDRYNKIKGVLQTQNYIVTPKDIDDVVEITARIISTSINNIV